MRKKTIIILTVILVLLGCLAGTYVAVGVLYTTHFFENTNINGIDVSEMTVEAAEALIAEDAEDYQVVITARDGKQETISGDAFGYSFVSNGEVQTFLEEQDILTWLPAYFSDGQSYTMQTSVTWDEELLREAVSGLACMQADQMTEPSDAYLEQQDDGSYTIVEENEGTTLDMEKVQAAVLEAVRTGAQTVDLEEEACYETPLVYSDDEELQTELTVRNQYAAMEITYQMGGDAVVVLDASTFADWLTLDDQYVASFDYESVSEWVEALADTYDTIGVSQPFVTSNGDTVYVTSVSYGWEMDRETEKAELYALLQAGESAERSPEWLESAGTRGLNDIGDTYVEIDYTNQRMWFYYNGELLVETPVVTGNVSAGNASPEGVFCILYKQRNATLVGEDYRTPVNYWMPFYGGVGIHDADSWRSTYGGTIYQTSGSHGCINTPTAKAGIIYEYIGAGTPVICYRSGINYGYSTVSVSGGTAGSSTAPATGTTQTETETEPETEITIIDQPETPTPETPTPETPTPETPTPETPMPETPTPETPTPETPTPETPTPETPTPETPAPETPAPTESDNIVEVG